MNRRWQNGHPTQQQVKKFALKLSNPLDVEIGGSYISNKGSGTFTHMSLGTYEGNTKTHFTTAGSGVVSSIENSNDAEPYKSREMFHTHLSTNGINNADYRTSPSPHDFEVKDGTLRDYPKFRFWIITDGLNDENTLKIEYTNTVQKPQ